VLTLHERYDEALEAEREALSVSRRQGHGEWQARAYTSIANILTSTGRTDEAEVQYLRAAEISKRTGSQFAEANNLHNLACLYAGVQRHPEAVQQLRAAMEIYRELGDAVGETAGLSTLAESLIALGEGAEALAAAKRALEVAVDASSVYHQGIATTASPRPWTISATSRRCPTAASLSVLTDLGAPEADGVPRPPGPARVSIRTPPEPPRVTLSGTPNYGFDSRTEPRCQICFETVFRCVQGVTRRGVRALPTPQARWPPCVRIG